MLNDRVEEPREAKIYLGKCRVVEQDILKVDVEKQCIGGDLISASTKIGTYPPDNHYSLSAVSVCHPLQVNVVGDELPSFISTKGPTNSQFDNGELFFASTKLLFLN